MNKIVISLFALAAVSTAALADENRGDLRDSDTYFGKYSTQLKDSSTGTSAFTVMDDVRPATNFERMKWQSEENENGGN